MPSGVLGFGEVAEGGGGLAPGTGELPGAAKSLGGVVAVVGKIWVTAPAPTAP